MTAPQLGSRFIDSVLTISGLAQECAVQTDLPQELLEQMTQLFDSRSCVYYPMGEILDERPLESGIGFKIDRHRVKQYQEHYWTMDPCFKLLRKKTALNQPPIISTDQVIQSEYRYVNSEYYQDFLKPQQVHNSIILGVQDRFGMLGLFGFHRTWKMPHYTATDHLKARLFAAQIAAGLRLHKLNEDRARSHALARQLMDQAAVRGYLILDRHFRLVDCAGNPNGHLNIEQDRFISAEEKGTSVESRLPADLQDYIRRLFESNRQCTSQNDMMCLFDNISHASHIRVELLDASSPNPLVLLLFLDENSELVSSSRMQSFGLTEREREIVHQLCRGLTNVQIAGQLGISAKTVEHHLAHIYNKTQTSNRVALIRQLSC